MARALPTVLFGFFCAFAATQVVAQSRDNMFARDRNVSVLERPRPGYQAKGIPLGGFTAFPKLELGVQDNSNIYATPSNARSDAIGLINPEVDIVSNWSRNALQAFARGASRQYASKSSETTTDYEFGGSGRLDAGETSVKAGGDYGYYAAPRSASLAGNTISLQTVHPIQYYQGDLNVGAEHTFNRVRVSGGVVYSTFDYQNAVDNSGTTIVESAFNHNTVTGTGKVEYAVSPNTAMFVTGSVNSVSYGTLVSPTSQSLNSSGETVDVGVNFDLSHLVRGEVQIGYLHQTYAEANLGASSGFNALGKVEWFPTQLTTVTFSGSRAVNASTLANAPAYIAGVVSGEVDHELLRNVILSGSVRYEADDYHGIDRHDKDTDFTLGANYLMNRAVGFRLAYDYLDQTSAGAFAAPSFNISKVTLSTVLQY